MTQPVQEADIAPDLKSSEANAVEGEHHHFRALHRRLEAAAEALKRVRDQLQTRAVEYLHCGSDCQRDYAEPAEPEPDGGRP